MLANDTWLKVWKIESHKSFTKIQASSSHRTGKKIETDYSGFVALFGKAHEKAVMLSEEDVIYVKKMGITTKCVNGKYYTNVMIFEFETYEEVMGKPYVRKKKTDEISDEELPFS